MIAQATFGYVVPTAHEILDQPSVPRLTTRLDVIRVFRELGGIIRMILLHFGDTEEWLGSIEHSREATAHQVMMPIAVERGIFEDEELKFPSLQNNYDRGVFPQPVSDAVASVYGTDRLGVKEQGDAFFRERERRQKARAKLKRAKNVAAMRERDKTLRLSYMRRTLVAGRPYEKYWYLGRGPAGRKEGQADSGKEA